MFDRFLIQIDVLMKASKKFKISRMCLHREFNQENKSSVQFRAFVHYRERFEIMKNSQKNAHNV